MAGFGEWLHGLLGSKAEPDAMPSLRHVLSGPSGAESLAEGNNDFALALYGLLRPRTGNLLFSPFSIRTALGMTQAGATGDTAVQMRDALRLSFTDGTPHGVVGDLVRRLNAAGGGSYEMVVANSLWGQDGALVHPEFLDVIAGHYGGALNLVDFRRGLEAARSTINQWVEHQTRYKIRELIPLGGLDATTRLVLVNAVYFKALWMLPFRRTATRDEPFHLENGKQVQVPLMHQREDIRYLHAAGYQAVDLIYRGDDLSMLVLLPDRNVGLRKFENTLSLRMLEACVQQMELREVMLSLPRFKITCGGDMREHLTALGMPLAFTPEANFSGINGQEPPSEESLLLSGVFHRAVVDVDEQGTEAAAATAGDMVASALGPPAAVATFRADRPFLFAIRDRKSGAILFFGRVADPTQES